MLTCARLRRWRECDAPAAVYCSDGTREWTPAWPRKAQGLAGRRPALCLQLYCPVEIHADRKRAVENGPCADGRAVSLSIPRLTTRLPLPVPIGGDCSADPAGCVFTACDHPPVRRGAHLGQLCAPLQLPWLCGAAFAAGCQLCLSLRRAARRRLACANNFEYVGALRHREVHGPTPNDGAPYTDTRCASGVCSARGTAATAPLA
jgi:hypothetical protein